MNMDEPITGPEDWRELAKLPVDELLRQLHLLQQRPADESEAAAWIRLTRMLPRIRALKEHLVGKAFDECALPGTGYSRTQCHKIVASGIADLDILNQIWERVRMEAHAAELRGGVYCYPSLSQMLGWYRQLESPTKLTEEERRILDEIEPYWRRDHQRRNKVWVILPTHVDRDEWYPPCVYETWQAAVRGLELEFSASEFTPMVEGEDEVQIRTEEDVIIRIVAVPLLKG